MGCLTDRVGEVSSVTFGKITATLLSSLAQVQVNHYTLPASMVRSIGITWTRSVDRVCRLGVSVFRLPF